MVCRRQRVILNPLRKWTDPFPILAYFKPILQLRQATIQLHRPTGTHEYPALNKIKSAIIPSKLSEGAYQLHESAFVIERIARSSKDVLNPLDYQVLLNIAKLFKQLDSTLKDLREEWIKDKISRGSRELYGKLSSTEKDLDRRETENIVNALGLLETAPAKRQAEVLRTIHLGRSIAKTFRNLVLTAETPNLLSWTTWTAWKEFAMAMTEVGTDRDMLVAVSPPANVTAHDEPTKAEQGTAEEGKKAQLGGTGESPAKAQDVDSEASWRDLRVEWKASLVRQAKLERQDPSIRAKGPFKKTLEDQLSEKLWEALRHLVCKDNLEYAENVVNWQSLKGANTASAVENMVAKADAEVEERQRERRRDEAISHEEHTKPDAPRHVDPPSYVNFYDGHEPNEKRDVKGRAEAQSKLGPPDGRPLEAWRDDHDLKGWRYLNPIPVHRSERGTGQWQEQREALIFRNKIQLERRTGGRQEGGKEVFPKKARKQEPTASWLGRGQKGKRRS